MKKEIYIKLIANKLSGELSTAEQKDLSDWLNQSEENQKIYDQMVADWDLSATAKKSIEVNVAEDFSKLQNRIQAAKASKDGKGNSTAKVIPMRRTNFRWVYIAASFLLLATAWFVFSPDDLPEQLVVKTTLGETRTIALEDGTKIWMNENSELSYPENFTTDKREVSLQGEAYFDVAKNPEVAFVVRLKDTNVEVLGTEFNIKESESQEEVLVHVTEGKVRFSEKVGSDKIELTVNQSATYSTETKNISKLQGFNKNATSWKTNSLIFEATRLSDVLADVSEHFGKSVSVEKERLKGCTFSGYYPKPDANAVLSNVASSFGMTLTQDRNGNYLLKGGECETQE